MHWRVTSKDPMTLVLCSNRLIVKPCEAKNASSRCWFLHLITKSATLWQRRSRPQMWIQRSVSCGVVWVDEVCFTHGRFVCYGVGAKGCEMFATCNLWQSKMCLANKFYLAPGLRHILTLRLHPCVFSFLQAALTGASAWILEETTGSMLAWNIQSEIIYYKYLKGLTIGPHCTAASHLDISQSPTRWRRSTATRSKPKERQQMSSVVNNPWTCKYINKKLW